MNRDENQQPEAEASGGPFFEFFDVAHEVTDEERNRPRYGRPVRKPTNGQPEAPKEDKDDGNF
jgi:hypothetical protein